jgi:hypothetical protein
MIFKIVILSSVFRIHSNPDPLLFVRDSALGPLFFNAFVFKVLQGLSIGYNGTYINKILSVRLITQILKKVFKYPFNGPLKFLRILN